MPTTYSGSAKSFPAGITLPSDGEKRRAQSVNAGLSDARDGIAFLEARSCDPAQNFRPLFNPLNSTGRCLGYKRNSATGKLWYVAGGANDKISYSHDLYTWTAATTPSGGLPIKAIAMGGPNGGGANGIAVSESSGDIYRTTDHGATWNTVTGLPGTPDALFDAIWDDVHSQFIVVGGKGGPSWYLATSPTGATASWTERTLPVGPTSARIVRQHAAGARLVVLSFDDIHGAYSDDLATWTAVSGFPVADASAPTLAHSFAHGLWLSTRTNGDVYKSSDGITWSLQGATRAKLTSLVAYNGSFAGTVDGNGSNDGQVAYSLDQGVTWYCEPVSGSGELTTMILAKNRLLAGRPGEVWSSPPFGRGEQLVI